MKMYFIPPVVLYMQTRWKPKSNKLNCAHRFQLDKLLTNALINLFTNVTINKMVTEKTTREAIVYAIKKRYFRWNIAHYGIKMEEL